MSHGEQKSGSKSHPLVIVLGVLCLASILVSLVPLLLVGLVIALSLGWLAHLLAQRADRIQYAHLVGVNLLAQANPLK